MCKNLVYFGAPSLSASGPHFSCSGDGTGPNCDSHAMMSSEIFVQGLFVG